MDKIALIQIKGPILGEGQFFLSFGVQVPLSEIRKLIAEVSEKDEVKGVIFEIDSPGGAPYHSRELAKAVRNLGKPKVAWIRENGLSGAYWVASSCDLIVADELSNVGGLGVAALRPDFSDFFEKLGIKFDSSATGKFKELGLPFTKKGEEERKFMEEQLKAVNEIFMKDIAEHRKLDAKTMKELSKGKPYLGRKAKELGLIDRLGGRGEAIEACERLSGTKGAEVVDYGERLRKESKGILGGLIRRFF